MIPRSARRKISSIYEAALPLHIAQREVAVPCQLSSEIADLRGRLAQFDERQRHRGYDLPALLLRSESSASSQIERLTSSVRNVALAEVSKDAPANARLIAGNVSAMRAALSLAGEMTVDDVLAVHAELMRPSGESFAGRLRDDVEPIVQAAVLHAQLESIHPFIDGNGRTGRALIHRVLRRGGVLEHATIPISAGLLHDVDAYMEALGLYQEGRPVAVVEQLVRALNEALVLGARAAAQIDAVLDGWRDAITERRGSSIHRLPEVLVEQPVINVAFVAGRLGITSRAASSLVARACEYGILRAVGNRHRGEYYQADELISVLEEISGSAPMRRGFAQD